MLAACVGDKEEPAWELPDGSPLPQFSVTTSTGDVVSTSTFSGRGGMIVLFNTSCPDCRRELPEVQRIYDAATGAGSGEVYICIARDEGEASIAAYWEEAGLTLPYSPQPDREVYDLFASRGIPRIFLVSPDLVVTQGKLTGDR